MIWSPPAAAPLLPQGLLNPLLTSPVRFPRVEFSTEGDTVKFRALHFPEVLGARGTVLGHKKGEVGRPGVGGDAVRAEAWGRRTNALSRGGSEE